jgi:hypothetical protein
MLTPPNILGISSQAQVLGVMSLPHTNPLTSPWNGPGRSADTSVIFRFPITWSCLLEPFGTDSKPSGELPFRNEPNFAPQADRIHPPLTGAVPELPRVSTARPTPPVEMVPAAPMTSTPPASSAPKTATTISSAAQWEMVVPKMDRPSLVGKPRVVTPTQDPTPQEPPQIQRTVETARAISAPAPVESSAAIEETPGLLFGSALSASPEPLSARVLSAIGSGWSSASLHVRIAAVGAALLAATFAFWLSSGSAPPAAAGRWVRVRESFAKKEEGDQKLVLFRTNTNTPDYRFEFEWKPDTRGVGWVFRSSGINRTYQTARISLLPNHNPPTLALERYSVLASVEGPHAKKFIQLVGNTPSIPIRLDATGPAFNVYIKDRLADTWIDERFIEGDAGFVIDPEGLPGLQTVQIDFLHAPNVAGYRGSFQNLWNSLP